MFDNNHSTSTEIIDTFLGVDKFNLVFKSLFL